MFPGADLILAPLKDTVMQSAFDALYSWVAQGLVMLIEWVWSTLDTATTPHLSEPWFLQDTFRPMALLGLGITVAMMLASSMQASLAGRPDQIIDAVKQGAWAVTATALTVTVTEVLVGGVDEISAEIWGRGRPDAQSLLEGVVRVMDRSWTNQMGFISVLIFLFMALALLALSVALLMRNSLIYVTAAVAPLIFSSSVLPLFRPSARKMIQLNVSLILAKLAIVITLVLSTKMMGNATEVPATGSAVQDGASALGVLVAGLVCFMIAALSPMVLYRLLPTVEGAAATTGIAGGWSRAAVSGLYAASTAQNMASGLGRMLANTSSDGDDNDSGSGGGRPPPPFPTGSPAPPALELGSGGAASSAGVGAGLAVVTAGLGVATRGMQATGAMAGSTADAASGAGGQVQHPAGHQPAEPVDMSPRPDGAGGVIWEVDDGTGS
jgi:hypothetical protein